MKYFATCLIALFTSFNGFSRCGGIKTLSSDLTIDISDPTTFNSVISTSLGSTSVLINKDVIVPAGIRLKILGVSGNRLGVQFKPGLGIEVNEGGLLIVEYCDLESEGNCGSAGYNNTTWDGILVHGDASKDHYDTYDLVNGWDPYADPFVPGGTYKSDGSGGYAHGRAQIRWCTFKEIKQESVPTTAVADDASTPFANESNFGNYAIRSTTGGILNVIDCDFKDVRIGVVIDNYERFPTGDPNSKFMNAFQIVDCDFTVTSIQRQSTFLFRHCIELHKAQKVTIEGCTFKALGSSTFHNAMGTAIYMYESSILFHKSGNFRRSQDFISSEGRVNCPLYGNEQSNLGGYDANHPWKTNTPRKCTFEDFYRAVYSKGTSSKTALYTTVMDDCEFNDVFLPVFVRYNEAPTFTRCTFDYDESDVGFTSLQSISNQQFDGHGLSNPQDFGNTDRCDIASLQCTNTLVSECSFASDYDGVGTVSKNIYIALVSQEAGTYNNQGNGKYVYDLVYKCSFSSAHAAKDVGAWFYKGNANLYGLVNCNNFTGLKSAVAVGHNQTKLRPQFHYTDRKTGQDASPNNTFGTNTQDFWFPPGYAKGPINYYLHNTEISPTENSTGNISTSPTTEKPDCSEMTCEEFPMTSVREHELSNEQLTVYPNPAQDRLMVLISAPSSSPGKVSVHNVTGAQVLSKSVSPGAVSVELALNLENGLYFIVYDDGRTMLTQKVVISN